VQSFSSLQYFIEARSPAPPQFQYLFSPLANQRASRRAIVQVSTFTERFPCSAVSLHLRVSSSSHCYFPFVSSYSFARLPLPHFSLFPSSRAAEQSMNEFLSVRFPTFLSLVSAFCSSISHAQPPLAFFLHPLTPPPVLLQSLPPSLPRGFSPVPVTPPPAPLPFPPSSYYPLQISLPFPPWFNSFFAASPHPPLTSSPPSHDLIPDPNIVFRIRPRKSLPIHLGRYLSVSTVRECSPLFLLQGLLLAFCPLPGPVSVFTLFLLLTCSPFPPPFQENRLIFSAGCPFKFSSSPLP